MFLSITGIPAGIVYARMGKFLLFPVGAKVVTKKQAIASAVASELAKRQNMNKARTQTSDATATGEHDSLHKPVLAPSNSLEAGSVR